jgi:transcriptional regulator with XRE-family HTH domain
VDRPELADFLRRSRARLAPSDVGLAAGPRRRTPGLRREEVAQLAGMSVDYYARLEQARGPRPSRQLLTALGRGLRLTADERDHLFHLAGEEPPRDGGGSGHVRPGLLLILDRLYDTPAQVLSDIGEVLAQNAMSKALHGDVTGRPAAERNIIRGLFLGGDGPSGPAGPAGEERGRRARNHVAQLRAVVAARPGDRAAAALVAELRAGSGLFARLWDDHEVAVHRSDRKRFHHPVVGELELECEALLTDDRQQRLVVFTARPGSEAYERLQLLRVVGLQDLNSPPDDVG